MRVPEATPVLPRGKFHGCASSTFRLAEMTLVETVYPEGEVLAAHAHQRPYVCTVLRGSFEETSGNVLRRCHSSTVLLRPAGETHADRFGPSGAICLNVELSERFVGRLQLCADLFTRPVQLDGGAAWLLALRLGREYRAPDEVSPLAVECLVLEMLLDAWRARKHRADDSRWLERARQLLHDRFRECLSLSEIAGCVSVHPVHLARQFRRRFGVTVGEYHRRLRVEFVCRQLSERRCCLAELAAESGFADQSHLTRTFRRLIGVTPAVFARQAQSLSLPAR